MFGCGEKGILRWRLKIGAIILLKLLAEVGRPMASLAILLAMLLNLVTFLMKELYGWSLKIVTQNQYSYNFTKIKKIKK